MDCNANRFPADSIDLSEAAQSRAAHFEACVGPQLRALRHRALALSRNRADAEDLLQETVLRAWRFWFHYRTDNNLHAWLQRILLNTFRSRYRRGRRERELVLRAHAEEALFEDAAFEPSAMRQALSDEVEQGLSALPKDYRAVLWAIAVDELSYRETAELLGCPIGTVMSRLHRARRALLPSLQHAAHV